MTTEREDMTHGASRKCLMEKGPGLTSVLHSGSLDCRPGISLMAEDKLPLHEVTLLWCPTLKRLARYFFSDAGDRKAKTVRGEIEGKTCTISVADLAFKWLSRGFSPVCLPPIGETAQATSCWLRLLPPQLTDCWAS